MTTALYGFRTVAMMLGNKILSTGSLYDDTTVRVSPCYGTNRIGGSLCEHRVVILDGARDLILPLTRPKPDFGFDL